MTVLPRCCLLLALALSGAGVFALAFPATALAAGTEYSAAQDDIRLAVNGKWVGGRSGGYYPIRVSMRNVGPTRTLAVHWEPNDVGMPLVTRTVTIDQNASASFTLLVPLVGDNVSGNLRVFHQGDELKNLTRNIDLPDTSYDGEWPSLLVISDRVVDASGFNEAVVSQFARATTTYYYGAHPTEAEQETVAPSQLPDSWLAYSGVDIVAISLEALAGLSEELRTPLLEWVHAGGTLLIHSVGEPVSESARLLSLTGLNRQRQPTNWKPANLELNRVVQRAVADQYGNVSYETDSAPQKQWAETAELFAVGNAGLGRIVSFRDSPYGGSLHDWSWLLNSLPKNRLAWSARHGANGRDDNQEFLAFLIPGVKTIPAVAFLIFITVFAFVIGPLNYFMLKTRRRLNFLVVTIPIIAAATSVLLFGYSLVAHGISVRSRVRSFTVLDQGTQTAVAMSRLALYAGLAPSSGLRFSTATEVVPIWPENTSFTQGHVDWSETQNLASGFLRSRTRTQFLTTAVRAERGRLNVEPDSSAGLKVTNGLEWDLEALIVSDADGKLWYGSSVAAGSALTLAPIDDAARDGFEKLLARSAPAIPEELRDTTTTLAMNLGFDPRRYMMASSTHNVSSGQMEAGILELAPMIRSKDKAPASRYVAVCKEAPSIEFGSDVQIVDGWHVLLGYY